MRRSSAGRLFHTDGPETENARRPNEVRVRVQLSRLSFYGQLMEQLNVASLSRPTVFLQWYSLLLFLWTNK